MTLDVRGVAPLLMVYDMPTAVRFYRETLGFEVVSTSPVLGPDRFHWALMKLGDAEIMLNTAYETDEERPPSPVPSRVEAHGDTILYLACPDVDAAYAELSAKGAPVRKPGITHYGMKQMYLRDPDGYGLCFQWKTA